MSWRVVALCLVVLSSASGFYHHGFRGFENEQFQANQQFSGQQGMQWSRTRVTPNVVGIIRQGLGMLEYDPANIQIQEARKRIVGNGLDFKVSFVNPILEHNCIFQVSYCAACSISISPLTPACSKPCPGQVCRVDTSLRHMDLWFKSHRKSWQDRKYDEQDYEGHTINKSADEFSPLNGGSGLVVGSPSMNMGMGMGMRMAKRNIYNQMDDY